MKKSLLFLLTSTLGLFAQNEPELLFSNTENSMGYGGQISTIASAKDLAGNTYLVGTFSGLADFDPSAADANITSNGSSDLFVAVYDSNGVFLGVRNIGGTGIITPSAITIDGNFIYIAGTYSNTIDFDPSAAVANLTATTNLFGYNPGFLAKYDLNGNFVTCKSIDGLGSLIINEMKIANNQLVIVGRLAGVKDFDPSANVLQLSSINQGQDAFMATYNTSLLLQVARIFGGNDWDIATSLALDSAGNILVSGIFKGTSDFDPSANEFNLTSVGNGVNTFIAKYSTTGNFQWAKNIGGIINGNPFTVVNKLVLDLDNNIFLTGWFDFTSDFDPSGVVANLTPSGSDIFIARYDANGNYVWAKKIGSSGADASRNIAIDSSNNIYIFGTFTGIVDFDTDAGISNLDIINGTNFFAKYSSNGTFVYANNLVASVNTALVDNSNALVLSGTFGGIRDFDPSTGTATLSSSNPNVFLAKYAANGTFLLAKAIGGDKPINQVINYIATDQNGAIYRAGQLSATTDIDPSTAIFNISSSEGQGLYVSKYTATGTLLWGNAIAGTISSSVGISTMNTDPNGNTYIVGGFTGTVDFDPSANVANMTANSTATNNLFIAKYDNNGNYLWAKQIAGSISARRKLVFDSVGNFYFSGTFSGNNLIDVDPSPTNVFNLSPSGLSNSYFIKFDSQGVFIWAKTINTINVGSLNFTSITQFDIKDNQLYMTGRFSGAADFNPSLTVNNVLSTIIPASNETFFAKYNLNGDYQLAFKFDNGANNAVGINKGSSFAIDSDGAIFLLSTFFGTVDFDPSPTGAFNITAVPSSNNLAILKYTSNGIFEWAKNIRPVDESSWFNSNNSIQSNEWLSSAYIKNNELIIVGAIFGNIDFDPSANDFILNSSLNLSGNFNFNFFVAKYDKSTGNLLNANKIAGDYTSELFNTCMDNNQNLLVAGSFMGTADFDFSSAIQNLSSASPYNNDRFYAKYGISTLGIAENTIANGYIIYPNPTSTILNVSHIFYDNYDATIIDISGKVLKREKLTNQKGIDVSAFPSGIYFIQIENGLEKNTYKFIKN